MHQITAYGGLKPAPFQRAVPLSGNQEQENTSQEFLTLLKVSTLQEARKLNSGVLIAANYRQILNASCGTYVYGPVVDSAFAPAPLTSSCCKGLHKGCSGVGRA
jgi:hypothetical protein